MVNITLQEVKQYCRIDEDHRLEDNILQIYIEAALEVCQKHIGRQFGEGLEFTASIKAGCLMYIGFLYENREMVTQGTLLELPMSVSALWGAYRDPAIY